MACSMPGFPVHHQLPELTQTHVHWVSDTIQSSHLLSSPFPPAFNLPQHQGLFQRVSSFHHVVKLLELLVYCSAFCDYSGFISFRIYWFDPLAVQGTLESLLQHHSSKASVLCQWYGVHRCMDLSLGFLFCSIDLYFCLCASTILSCWL